MRNLKLPYLLVFFGLALLCRRDGAFAQPGAKAPAVDAVGDPLPDGARLRLGTLRFRPPDSVSAVALSPDEKTVVTVGGHLIVWDNATGRELWRVEPGETGFHLTAAAYGRRPLAFEPEGAWFYTPGEANEVNRWNLTTGERRTLILMPANPIPPEHGSRGTGHGFQSIDVAADGKLLALGSPRSLVVCEPNGQIVHEIANHVPGDMQFPPEEDGRFPDRLKFGGHFTTGQFTPDGAQLAVVLSESPDEIQVLEVGTWQLLRKIQLSAWMVRIAFSPDGKRIVATERDSSVRMYDVETGKPLWSHTVKLTDPYENYTSAIAYCPDGKRVVAAANNETLRVLDAADGKEVGVLGKHSWNPWTLAFTRDGQMLYSAGWGGAIHRWNINTLAEMPLPTGVRGLGVAAISPDGETIAYEDAAGTIRLVDATTGAERQQIAEPGSTCARLRFSPDGRQLAGGGTNGENVHVTVWNLPSGEIAHRFVWPKGKDPHSTIGDIRFSPTGDRLAACVFRQNRGMIWDLTTSRKIVDLVHSGIYGLSFQGDSERLATAGWDSAVRFWHVGSGRADKPLPKPKEEPGQSDHRMYAVCFAADSNLFATAQLSNEVRLRQTSNHALRRIIKIDRRFTWGAIDFSPDGLWLATGASSGALEVWDPATGEKVWESSGHFGSLYSVEFGPGGRTLLSSSSDGICYLWDLHPQVRPTKDLPQLWIDLTAGDSRDAFEAMGAFARMREQAVPYLAGKLAPIETAVDADQDMSDLTDDEKQRIADLERRRMDGAEDVARTIVVRRALSVLAQIGTPEAAAALKTLASQKPKSDIARLATLALNRLEPSRP